MLVLLMVTLISLTMQQIASDQLREDAQTLLVIIARDMVERLERDIAERAREIEVATSANSLLSDPALSHDYLQLSIESLQRAHPSYSWIGMANAAGELMAATGRVGEGENVAEQAWFQNGRRGPYVGDGRDVAPVATFDQVLPDSGSTYFVVYAAPVVGPTGELIGVLGAILNWAWIQDLSIVGQQALNNEWHIEMFIVTQHSELLSNPTGWGAQSLDLAALTTRLDGESSGVMTWPDGEQYLTVISPIHPGDHYASLGWLVIVRQPLLDAYGTAQRIQWSIVAIGGIYALAFSGVVWLLTTRLTRQLQSITTAADRIRQGDTNVDIPLLTGSAEVATLSASLNQLIQELTTATMAERNRIARDLHDSVTQTLFSASMLADILPRLWQINPEQGAAKLEELRRAVRGAHAEMRTLLLELRPTALIDTEMDRLLRQVAYATSGRSGLTVNWQIEGTGSLLPNVKVAFYRIVQEALSNVVKHAAATQADILLRYGEGQVELIIRDDGRGFAPANVTGDHFGLDMMQERINTVGGMLAIQSEIGAGTTITVRWRP
ncbi:MAG: HAMP domain-containing protein [Caldilineaceae bacterium]|nr:HAMP domain-containing protein [Caldilineaceae bacterium]